MATVIRKSGGVLASVDSDSNFERIDWGPSGTGGYQGNNVGAGASKTFTIPADYRIAIATVYVTSSNQAQTCSLILNDPHVVVAKEVSRSGWLAAYYTNAEWGHAQQVVTFYFETDGEPATFIIKTTATGNHHTCKVFLSGVKD